MPVFVLNQSIDGSIPVGLFAEILKTHDLSHFTEVNGAEVRARAVLVTDIQEIAQCVVSLRGSVARYVLIGSQLFLQKAEHDFFTRNVRTKTITERPVTANKS